LRTLFIGSRRPAQPAVAHISFSTSTNILVHVAGTTSYAFSGGLCIEIRSCKDLKSTVYLQCGVRCFQCYPVCLIRFLIISKSSRRKIQRKKKRIITKNLRKQTSIYTEWLKAHVNNLYKKYGFVKYNFNAALNSITMTNNLHPLQTKYTTYNPANLLIWLFIIYAMIINYLPVPKTS
jgi:hypothetical protein